SRRFSVSSTGPSLSRRSCLLPTPSHFQRSLSLQSRPPSQSLHVPRNSVVRPQPHRLSSYSSPGPSPASHSGFRRTPNLALHRLFSSPSPAPPLISLLRVQNTAGRSSKRPDPSVLDR